MTERARERARERERERAGGRRMRYSVGEDGGGRERESAVNTLTVS